MSEVMTDAEIDDYLADLLKKHKDLFAQSKAELEDLSKIDESKWEEIFKNQVKPYFTSLDDFSDADFDELYDEATQQADAFAAELEIPAGATEETETIFGNNDQNEIAKGAVFYLDIIFVGVIFREKNLRKRPSFQKYFSYKNN